MGCESSKENIVTPTTVTSSNGTIDSKRHMTKTYMLIWVDPNIDQSKKDHQNAVMQLQNVVEDVKVFIEPNQCIQDLNTINVENVFLIVSESTSQQTIPSIHSLPQLKFIYILCNNTYRQKEWTKQWMKIKGKFKDIKSICEALQIVVKRREHDSTTVNFVMIAKDTSNPTLDQLKSSYIYTKIFKDIVLDMEYNENSVKDFTTWCRTLYSNNKTELDIINEFEHDYQPKSSIWWYTRQCFVYQMLNRALRTLETDTMIKMSFFIHDLYYQIQHLFQQQIGNYHGKNFNVYQAQHSSTKEF